MAQLDHRDPYAEVIPAALAQQVRLAGDIIEIEKHTWAIHGVIPVDGEVILAEFDTATAARAVLDSLTGTTLPSAR